MRSDETSCDSLFPRDESLARGWEDLGVGAPTLIALAKRCSLALAHGAPTPSLDALSAEARALLLAAADRGVFELKGINTAFDAPERWLAVHIERRQGAWLVFRVPGEPRVVVRFLDAFAELCSAGLVMHHLYRDFSLTRGGFELAELVRDDPRQQAELAPLLRSAQQVDYQE